MILIIGGAFQGKRGFAGQRIKERTGRQPAAWCDGASAGWEEYCRSEWKAALPAMVKRRMETEGSGFSGEGFAEELCRHLENQVIISEEIGSGIVPMDEFSRAWREETGRILCRLAAQADQVWRVVGGIGQRIK